MDGFDTCQGHMHGPVHGCTGLRENAGDGERRLVVVLETDLADAVRNDDAFSHRVTERRGRIRTEHSIVDVGKPRTGYELKPTITPIAVVFKVRPGGAEYTVAAMGITKRQRNGPRHFRARRDLLIACPTEPAGRVTDPEYRVQQQIDWPTARSDNQIRARNGVGETRSGLGPDAIHADQQRDADRHGQDSQARG